MISPLKKHAKGPITATVYAVCNCLCFSLIWLLLFTVTCLFSLNNNTIFSPQPQGQTHRFLHHLVEDVKQVSSEATAYNDTNIKLRTYRY